MAVSLAPIGNGFNWLNGVGSLPNSGGKINTYLAGTTTPANTYTSNTGLVLNANPIIMDVAGRPANSGSPVEIWLTNGIVYKFVVTDALNNIIGTYDNLTGINDVGGTTLIGNTTITGNLTVSGTTTLNGPLSETSFSQFDDTVTITGIHGTTLASGYGAAMAFAAGMASSTHRWFFGDGSGWKIAFSKRNAGVTTDMATLSDAGAWTAVSGVFSSTLLVGNGLTVTASGVTINAGGLGINGGYDIVSANGGAFTFSSTHTGQLLYFIGGGDNTNVVFSNNSRGLDLKQWAIFYGSDASFRIRVRNDSGASPSDALSITRATNTIAGIQLACMNVIANNQNGNYTFVLTDAGKPVYKNTVGAVTATWTIPTNASVAFPIGAKIEIINHDSAIGGTVSLSPSGGVSLFLAGVSGTATRTMTGDNAAGILQKIATDAWIVWGVGIT